MRCLIHGPIDQKYSEKVRAFALTLQFHSPRAYKFVREQFNDHLPHPSTMRKWYMVSKTDGKPGFSKSSMDALQTLAQEHKSKGEQLVCALIYDEMAIRRHIEWSDAEKRFVGRVDYGFNVKNDALPMAKNAIVYMISGVNRKFIMPIAFFFIDTLNGDERKHLLLEITAALTELNVRLIGVTFDGYSANFTMCTQLGASFNLTNFQSYFRNHITNDKIHIILDPSHMLKLVRNMLATYKVFHDATGSKIEWKYFELLETFRTERGLTMSHKMNKKHMQWFRNKMKVSLAAQTLSEFVASSMEILMKSNYPEFADCTATVKFIRHFIKLFDILNSEKDDFNIFKSPIASLNKHAIISFFDEAIPYIMSLKLNGQKLVTSQQRTGFVGFLICMHSVKAMYGELVETNLMDRLPVFRFSQDPLEQSNCHAILFCHA